MTSRERGEVRTFITGVDADGRSCVVSQDELTLDQLAPGFAMGIPYATTTNPPPARPAGTASVIDQGIAPGLARWMVVELGPDSETPMHHTDTIEHMLQRADAALYHAKSEGRGRTLACAER